MTILYINIDEIFAYMYVYHACINIAQFSNQLNRLYIACVGYDDYMFVLLRYSVRPT